LGSIYKIITRSCFLAVVVAMLACDTAPVHESPIAPVETEWVYSFVRDYDYAYGRIFDLGRPGEFAPGDSIVTLLLYHGAEVDDPEAKPCRMVVNPAYPDSFLNEMVSGAGTKLVDQTVYQVANPINQAPYAIFSLGHQFSTLAAWMQVRRSNGELETIGDIDTDTLLLKKIHGQHIESTHQTWNLMWRNCYRVPLGLPADEIRISIHYALSGREASSDVFETQEDPLNGNNQSYIEILGLDQFNSVGTRFPDGLMDTRIEIYRPDWGLLIFPHRTPFDSDTTFSDSLGSLTQELLIKVPMIYQRQYFDDALICDSRYFIKIGVAQPH